MPSAQRSIRGRKRDDEDYVYVRILYEPVNVMKTTIDLSRRLGQLPELDDVIVSQSNCRVEGSIAILIHLIDVYSH